MMKNVQERCMDLLYLYLNNYSDETSSFNIEFLFDTLTCLYYECSSLQHRNERNCLKFCDSVKPLVEKIESCRLARTEFETIRLIGSGAFGEVSLVRSKTTNDFFALKSLHKYDMLKRSDRACFQEERDVLVKGIIKCSPWLTQLHYTFQDEKYLYFVMKFYNGGDMLTMLSKFDDQIPEDITQFYLAELVLAINSLHELGYVHRDIKPDNVLLESSGHIVLTDFGSCLRIGNDGQIKNTAAVGTPDYIAPEILRAAEDSHGTFGVECDYWSLGIVMFEMLFGETPFYSENLIQTYSQIMNFEKTFVIPSDSNISDSAKDLLRRFICDRKQRYGRNGIEEIIKHPFFGGIDWENIRCQQAPYQPEVKSPEDTSNFDIEQTTRTHEGPPLGSVFRGCQIACIGFTFTKDSPFNQVGRLEGALEDYKSSVPISRAGEPTSSPFVAPCTKCAELQSHVQDLEMELAAISLRVQPMSPPSPKINGVSEASDMLATSEARCEDLGAEVKKLQLALSTLEGRSITDEKKITILTQKLQEECEKVENLKFDLREYEEENEDLCKRIQDTSLALRDKESACERLLNDLEEKRAESAAQRKLLDEYIQQTQKAAALQHRVVGESEKNLSNGVDDSAGPVISELRGRIREATCWAEKCEAKLSSQETYWTEQQLSWKKERSDLQDRIREIVLERTSFLEGELRQERQRSTALEQRVTVWENKLKELIQMADIEWATSDNLSEAIVQLMSYLELLRNGSMDLDYDIGHSRASPQPLAGEDQLQMLPTDMSSLDWRQRKAGRVSKMERGMLQLELKKEIRERDLAQQRTRDLELQLEEINARLSDASNRLLRTESEKDSLREQLMKVTSEVRRSRMKTTDVEESMASGRTKQLNERQDSPEPIASSLIDDQSAKLDNSTSLGCSLSTTACSSVHNLKPDSFTLPTRCYVCANLLMGQQWQGLRCLNCDLCCHYQCRQYSISCPVSAADQPSSSCDTNIANGLETVLEGPVKTPKGDIKRGWIQQYAFLFDMRLFIYDCNATRRARTVFPGGAEMKPPRSSTLGPSPGDTFSSSSSVFDRSASSTMSSLRDLSFTQITYKMSYDILTVEPAYIIDLNSPGFSVSLVSNTDVIHAKPNDVPQILMVKPDEYAGSSPMYLLFESTEDCNRWHTALKEEARILGPSAFHRLPHAPQCLQLHQIAHTTFPLLRHALSACVFDEHRILLGAEDGLYTVDLRYKAYSRIGEKKPIYQVEALPEELQLIAVIQDKQRRLRLVLSGAIEGMNYEKIRVAEPRQGVSSFCHGWSRGRTAYLLCAASLTSVWVYEVVREASRHHRVVELTGPADVQAVNLVRDGDWLAVGCESTFVIYNIWSKGSMRVLLDPSYVDVDVCLGMFQMQRFTAQLALSLSLDEFLLVFDNFAIYVDSDGKVSRPGHLFWPAKPLPRGFSYRQPFLHVFTESGLFLFNVDTSDWSASAAGLRRLVPLSPSDGHLCLMTQGGSPAVVAKLAATIGVAGGGSPVVGTNLQGVEGSLVYLPPPCHSMFASMQRRRNASLLHNSALIRPLNPLTSSADGFERQLDLGTIAPLNASVRVRKSRRFAFFSRGSLFTAAAPVDLPASSSSPANSVSGTMTSVGGRSFNKTRSTSSSAVCPRLVSAPTDFQHLAHQGPDVCINLIDLSQQQQQSPQQQQRQSSVCCSTGNFTLAVEEAIRPRNRDSEVSLQSTSSRQSTDRSLSGRICGSGLDAVELVTTEGVDVIPPLHQSTASTPTATPKHTEEEEAVATTRPAFVFSNNHHLQSQQHQQHQPQQQLDSPNFRDNVLALFRTLDSEDAPLLNSPVGSKTPHRL